MHPLTCVKYGAAALALGPAHSVTVPRGAASEYRICVSIIISAYGTTLCLQLLKFIIALGPSMLELRRGFSTLVLFIYILFVIALNVDCESTASIDSCISIIYNTVLKKRRIRLLSLYDYKWLRQKSMRLLTGVHVITTFSVHPRIIPLFAAKRQGDIVERGDTRSPVQFGKRQTWPPRVQVYLDSLPCSAAFSS